MGHPELRDLGCDGLQSVGVDSFESATESSTQSLIEARAAAVRALSRREYSVYELRSKLERSYDDATVEQVLDELLERNLLSDQRFAEVFVRSRIERGQGPMRIREELRQRGVHDDEIDAHLTFDTEFWFDLASKVLDKRPELARALQSADGGDQAQTHMRDRAIGRIGRFLAARGFPGDVIHQVLRHLE